MKIIKGCSISGPLYCIRGNEINVKYNINNFETKDRDFIGLYHFHEKDNDNYIDSGWCDGNNEGEIMLNIPEYLEEGNYEVIYITYLSVIINRFDIYQAVMI